MADRIDLYESILARRSVRRYDAASLSPADLSRVREIIATTAPLVPENRFEALLKDARPGESLVDALGAYGRITTPPHYLVPFVEGERHPLTDLGYRMEQIAVRLAGLGIGTCFVGALGREAEVRGRFDLPAGARIGAFLIFGRPSTALGGRAINSAMRMISGATNKIAADRLFYVDTFENPTAPPPDLLPLIEAGRNAPSAADAQPWRFLRHGGRLHLFVKRDNAKYAGGPRAEYRLHDGGTCMANVALALEALGKPGRWMPYDPDEADIPAHPAALQPLAVLGP